MLSIRARLTTMRRTGADAGISLTELLVTMVLMTIVSGLALNWLIGENTTDTKTQNSSYATGDARTVLQAWPALLQVADSPWYGQTTLPANGSPTPAPTATTARGSDAARFLALTANSITFNADVANAPSTGCANDCSRSTPTSQVTLALSGGALTQTIAQWNTSTNAYTTKSATFVRSGAKLAGTCLFTAYDVNGNQLGTTGCDSSVPLGSIARIVLSFAITPAQNGTPQTFQTSTTITGTYAPIVKPAPTPPAGI